MFDSTDEQFAILEDRLIEYMAGGGMDLAGWALRNESLELYDTEIICEEGAIPSYSTFSCSKIIVVFHWYQSGIC